MNTINELVYEIRRHKGYFWPEDSDELYLAYTFRYAHEYLKQTGYPIKGNIENMMKTAIQLDLDEIIENYYTNDTRGPIYIPPFEAIHDIVEWDIDHQNDDKETD